MSKEILKVGDPVLETLATSRSRTKPRAGIVTKVGRKWATVTFGSGRRTVQVDRETLALNGDAYGTRYFTPSGYEHYLAKDEIFDHATTIRDAARKLDGPQAVALRNLLAEIVSTLNERKSNG